jgi:hypothetical protein
MLIRQSSTPLPLFATPAAAGGANATGPPVPDVLITSSPSTAGGAAPPDPAASSSSAALAVPTVTLGSLDNLINRIAASIPAAPAAASPTATQAADLDPAAAMSAVSHIYNVASSFYQADTAMWGMRSKNYTADVVTHILLLCAELPVLLKFDMLQGSIDWHALRGVLTPLRQSLRFCIMTPAPQTVQIPTATATLSAEHGATQSTAFLTMQAKVYQKIDIMRTAVKDSIVKQLDGISHQDLAMRIAVLSSVCLEAASVPPREEDQPTLAAFNALSGMWREMSGSLLSMLPVIYSAQQANDAGIRIVQQQLRMLNAAATASAVPALGYAHVDQQGYLSEVRVANRNLGGASAHPTSAPTRDSAARSAGFGATGGHSQGTSKDIATCNNFNRGQCARPECAYRHQCSVCNSHAHNAANHGRSTGASGDYNHYLRDSTGGRGGHHATHGGHREDRNYGRSDSRSYGRSDSRSDSRSDNRNDNRNDSRSDRSHESARPAASTRRPDEKKV